MLCCLNEMSIKVSTPEILDLPFVHCPREDINYGSSAVLFTQVLRKKEGLSGAKGEPMAIVTTGGLLSLLHVLQMPVACHPPSTPLGADTR